MKLRDYQEEALDHIYRGFCEGHLRQLVTMPTATGKTVVMVRVKSRCKIKGPTLILAHQEDLLDQTAEKWRAANPDDIIGIEQADRSTDPNIQYDVILGSLMTLQGPRLLELLKHRTFSLVIIDEAHHVVATSYQNILKALGVGPGQHAQTLLIGFTATPIRMDGKPLQDVFTYHAFDYPLIDAMRAGYICDIEAYRVITKTDLSVLSGRGDFQDDELETLINNEERNNLILEKWKELGGERKRALVFCAGVAHAKEIADRFQGTGLQSCFCITGATRNQDRDITSFRNDPVPTLVTNVKKLIEGSDIPEIDMLILARPTKSAGLFMQMLGRGLRLNPSKKKLLVLDLVDSVKEHRNAVTTPNILGLPSDFDLHGESLLEAKDKMDRLLEKDPSLAAAASKLKKENRVPDNFQDLQRELERISLLVPDNIRGLAEKYSTLEWQVDDNDAILRGEAEESTAYVLPIKGADRKGKKYPDRIIRLQQKPGLPWQIQIYETPEEYYKIREKYDNLITGLKGTRDPKQQGKMRAIAKALETKASQIKPELKGRKYLWEDLEKVMKEVDRQVRQKWPWCLEIIDRSAPWMKELPSAQQLSLAKKLGIPVTQDMRKGDLSKLLDRKLRKI